VVEVELEREKRKRRVMLGVFEAKGWTAGAKGESVADPGNRNDIGGNLRTNLCCNITVLFSGLKILRNLLSTKYYLREFTLVDKTLILWRAALSYTIVLTKFASVSTIAT